MSGLDHESQRSWDEVDARRGEDALTAVADVQARTMRYLDGWCAAQSAPINAVALDPAAWSFLREGAARAFLIAIDAGVVTINNGWPTLPDGRRTHLFEQNKGKVSLCREGFLEVATAGMLACHFGWKPERLTFQSPTTSRTARPWAFDLLAYEDEAREAVAVAAEVKWRQRDVLDLLKAVKSCCERGPHDEVTCPNRRQSHHRKYQGLLDYSPSVLWLVGPDAFEEDAPMLVFSVSRGEDGVLGLEPIGGDALGA